MRDGSSLIQPHGSVQIDVPGGLLDLRVGSGDVVFLSESGEERVFPSHPLASEKIPRIESLALASGVLLAERFGRSLHFFSTQDLELRTVADLARDETDDPAFLSLRFVKSDGTILALYENGLVCLDSRANVRWHVKHRKYSHTFERIEQERVFFHDADGNEFAYDLRDGSELAC